MVMFEAHPRALGGLWRDPSLPSRVTVSPSASLPEGPCLGFKVRRATKDPFRYWGRGRGDCGTEGSWALSSLDQNQGGSSLPLWVGATGPAQP